MLSVIKVLKKPEHQRNYKFKFPQNYVVKFKT